MARHEWDKNGVCKNCEARLTMANDDARCDRGQPTVSPLPPGAVIVTQYPVTEAYQQALDREFALRNELRAAEQEAQTLREERDRLLKALRNVRLRAASGRTAGHHRSTPLTPERTIEKKDAALDGVIGYCAEVGVVGSVLR